MKNRGNQAHVEQSSREGQEQESDQGESKAKMANSYRTIKRLTFELVFRDAEHLVDDRVMTVVRGPKDSAILKFQCPYHECMGGGHDLTGAVGRMVQYQKGDLSGRSLCRGWSDEERPDQYHCSGELIYKIRAEFW